MYYYNYFRILNMDYEYTVGAKTLWRTSKFRRFLN